MFEYHYTDINTKFYILVKSQDKRFKSMNITETIKDSLKYPLYDWKKIIILGIFIVISGLSSPLTFFGITNNSIILLSVTIGLISGLLVNGYLFRIIKTSLDGENKLPEYNAWKNILIDGIKVFITFIVFIILPPLIILLIFLLIFGGLYDTWLSISQLFVGLGIESSNFFVTGILPGIENLFIITYDIGSVLVIILLFEFLIVLPLFLIAIANMAYEGEFQAAFRFRELIEIIGDIGWANLIKWYISTGIIFLLIFGIGIIISYLFSISTGSSLFYIISLLLTLILLPYAQMYYVRAVALIYKPE